jgi:hypothetical protein
MFVINPDPYSLPCYRIGPFTTRDISINIGLPECNDIEPYFTERFRDKNLIYTYNGREAINIALSDLNLKKDDIVTIFTTTGNFYISGCVTREIEKFCRWSRKIEPATRVILVNHEFGYHYGEIASLKKTGLPIIEDCAQSFFSQDENKTTGAIGDYAIYSFPKMFPLQIGGLLVSNQDCRLASSSHLNNNEKRYIKNVISYYIKRSDELIARRKNNYDFLAQKFRDLGLVERFTQSDEVVPGVFMFRKGKHLFDLPDLKEYFYSHGVQCSVFYGEESFFIPVHQALNEHDLLYFHKVMKSFIKSH